MALATSSMQGMHLSTHPRRGASEQTQLQPRRVSHDDVSRNSRPDDSTSSTTPSLNVVLPELEALGQIREKAMASGNEKRKLAWCKDVIKYVERKSEGTKISNPTLVQFIDESIGIINRLASSQSPLAESLYLRGDLLASGSFPTYHRKNPKAAFNDFELSARMGYAPSWFRIGRDYEILGDSNRARDAYERGCAVRDVGCIYRMGMANLLSQLGLPMNHEKAIPLLREAADLANLDTPQPSYIYGMLLAGEFSHVEVSNRLLIPTPDPLRPHQPATIESEARRRIQRAAYLNFGPAQYRCGWSYEYAQLECTFDPLLSVQYYSLASQAGEIEADLALSKWFLCGAEGCFEKNESLAFTFAEKAARKGLPSAEFAIGYYFEVGVGCEKSVEVAQKWYNKASSHGNNDAKERLTALEGPTPATLSRSQHEVHVDTQLVRKRTEAKMMSDRKTRAAAKENRIGNGSNGPSRGQPTPLEQPQMPSMDLRRKKTMRMVEETAKTGRGVAAAAPPPAKGMERGNPVDWDRRNSAPNVNTARPVLPPTRLAMPVNGSGPPRMPSPGPGANQFSNSRPPPSSPIRGPNNNNNNNGIYSSPGRPNVPGPGPPNLAQNGGGIAVKAPSSTDSQKQVYETFGEMGIRSGKAKVSHNLPISQK